MGNPPSGPPSERSQPVGPAFVSHDPGPAPAPGADDAPRGGDPSPGEAPLTPGQVASARRQRMVFVALMGVIVLALIAGAVSAWRIQTANATPEPRAAASVDPAQASGTLRGMGVAAAATMYQIWHEHLAASGAELEIEVDSSMTELDPFLNGDASFYAGAQWPTDLSLMTKCAAPTLTLPVQAIPIPLVVNVPGVDQINLNADTVAGIYSGTITTWNDPAIVELNPEASLPDLPVDPLYRSEPTFSTYDVLWWLLGSEGWEHDPSYSWPEGTAARGAATVDEMLAGLATPGAIGYSTLDLADEWPSGVIAAQLQSGESFHAPDGPTATAMLDHSPLANRPHPDDVVVVRDPDVGGYPIVLVFYVTVCGAYTDPAETALVKAVFGQLLTPEVQQAGVAVGARPISDDLMQRAQNSLAKIR